MWIPEQEEEEEEEEWEEQGRCSLPVGIEDAGHDDEAFLVALGYGVEIAVQA